ncbi:MAG: YkgJ family cysteine cluster protein [Methanothrix sp.]|nr:YkgJ family cysteine cluster protein [Methanothrix sp.]
MDGEGTILNNIMINNEIKPKSDFMNQITEGMKFTNVMSMKLKMQHLETMVDLNALIDLLISKGFISSREFGQRREMSRRSLEEEFARDPLQVVLDPTPDKYSVQSVSVNCSKRMDLCKGRCCMLSVPLSAQDLEEGIVQCNYGMPFTVAVSERGYCIHFDMDGKRCTIYENRPVVCRTYNCRDDNRIWQDFEAEIPEI